MKKAIKYLLTLIIALIVLPCPIYAASDSSISSTTTGPGNRCNGGNCGAYTRIKTTGGIRITFVDGTGHALASTGSRSYDFITSKFSSGAKRRTTYFNSYNGDKNKIAMASGGGFSQGSTSGESGFWYFGDVLQAYNNYLNMEDPSGSIPRVSVTSQYSGGHTENGFNTEVKFFDSLTNIANTSTAKIRVDAFSKAVAEITGGFSAESLIQATEQACNTGEEIFIFFEPLFLSKSDANNANYFGTMSDYAHLPINMSAAHLNENAYIVYYPREIPALTKGCPLMPTAFRGTPITDKSQLLNANIGFGIGVDWIAGSESAYCGSCVIENDKFLYDNKAYPGTLSIAGYGSVQEFAFKPDSSGNSRCCSAYTGRSDLLPPAWKTAYEQFCEKVEEGCCNEGVEIKSPYYVADINNCCYDDTESTVHEYDLNDLFCYDRDMKVNYFWKKCKINPYLDIKMTGDIDKDYCEIYCTERVYVEIPSAITATSGRYFNLTTTSHGTKSPYVEGYKRCRTRIDYDKWHKDYMTQIEGEIKAYNDFQQNQAYKLMYDDSIAASFATTESITVTCTLQHRSASDSCTYTEECTNDLGEPDECEKEDSASATSRSGGTNPTKTFTLSYTRYPFTSLALYPRPWYQVQIDEKRENDSAHIHTGIFLENDKKHYETSHGDWSAWDIRSQITTINNYLNQWNNKDIDGTSVSESCDKCSCEAVSGNSYWTCSRNTAQAESRQENVPQVRDSYNSKAQSANGQYTNFASAAKELEKKIDKCDNYFNASGGTFGVYEGVTEKEENYTFDADLMGFEYTQMYLSDYGKIEKEVNSISFSEDPGCEITGPFYAYGDEDHLMSPQYSDATKYSSGFEKMEDFKPATLAWQNTPNGFSQYRDEVYDSDKKFTQDAKYKAVCSWDEQDDIKYTLIPRGMTEETVTNVTMNKRQYRIFLTTLDGDFDTRWNLIGLGSNGKFDRVFANEGKTCNNRQNPREDGALHCALHVEHELIETGRCNGDSVTAYEDECEISKTPDILVNFKIVDPKNLFPSCPDGSCNYGYNWFKGNKGPETLTEIQTKGSRDNTYASSNVSYSYTLTSNDLKNIKKYNSTRTEGDIGGYSDFNLACSCDENIEECNPVPGTNTCKRSRSCVKCRSEFLTNLYNGFIKYDGSSHSVTPGIGNIESIRSSKPHWAG